MVEGYNQKERLKYTDTCVRVSNIITVRFLFAIVDVMTNDV